MRKAIVYASFSPSMRINSSVQGRVGRHQLECPPSSDTAVVGAWWMTAPRGIGIGRSPIFGTHQGRSYAAACWSPSEGKRDRQRAKRAADKTMR